MSDFPVLDSPRDVGNAEHNRVVMDVLGEVEAFIEETDSWVALPLRLVHDQAAGWHLELGPYSLDRADIEQVRAAIRAYDLATRGQATK